MLKPHASRSPSTAPTDAGASSSPHGLDATDQRRALRAASMLGLIAFASVAGWWLIPGRNFDPLEMLPAIVATQVVGALAIAAWLSLLRPPAQR